MRAKRECWSSSGAFGASLKHMQRIAAIGERELQVFFHCFWKVIKCIAARESYQLIEISYIEWIQGRRGVLRLWALPLFCPVIPVASMEVAQSLATNAHGLMKPLFYFQFLFRFGYIVFHYTFRRRIVFVNMGIWIFWTTFFLSIHRSCFPAGPDTLPRAVRIKVLNSLTQNHRYDLYKKKCCSVNLQQVFLPEQKH